MVRRALPLFFGGAAGAIVFLLTARQCFAGPFETLPPVVYDNWFMAGEEGMPIWTQSRDLQATIVIPSILGFLRQLPSAGDEPFAPSIASPGPASSPGRSSRS